MFSAKIPNDVRREIYRRDGFACALCGCPQRLQIHHVLPRSAGGGNTPRNLIALCSYCHAMAHGTNLVSDVWLSQDEIRQYAEEVEQACVEYLADMYAAVLPDPWRFDPRDRYDYRKEEDHETALLECRLCYERRILK